MSVVYVIKVVISQQNISKMRNQFERRHNKWLNLLVVIQGIDRTLANVLLSVRLGSFLIGNRFAVKRVESRIANFIRCDADVGRHW